MRSLLEKLSYLRNVGENEYLYTYARKSHETCSKKIILQSGNTCTQDKTKHFNIGNSPAFLHST